MTKMSRLTRFGKLMLWIGKLSNGAHLGQTICRLAKQMRARAPVLDFLAFSIEEPVLKLYARICVDDEPASIEGLIVAMTVDPSSDLFLVKTLNEVSSQLVTHKFALSKLRSLEQLPLDNFTKRLNAAMSLQSEILAAKDRKPTVRRLECTSPPVIGHHI